MPGWQADKRFSDQFIPEIKSILGLHLIADASVEDDQERNTDLIVLRLDGVRVGCRIRRGGYMHDYGDEFTIRTARPNGTKTELAKIIEGWGDYFFYGFGDPSGGRLLQWGLGDLKVFRLWFMRELVNCDRGQQPGSSKPNRDRSSDFRAFKWAALPPEFVVAASFLDRAA